MTKYRLNKYTTKLLKNDCPLFSWVNDSDEIVVLLNEQDKRIRKLENELELYKHYIEFVSIGDDVE